MSRATEAVPNVAISLAISLLISLVLSYSDIRVAVQTSSLPWKLMLSFVLQTFLAFTLVRYTRWSDKEIISRMIISLGVALVFSYSRVQAVIQGQKIFVEIIHEVLLRAIINFASVGVISWLFSLRKKK